MEPEELFRLVSAAGSPVVQDYIAPVYGSDILDAADRIIESAGITGHRIIDIASDDYPPLLKHLRRPPVVLYVEGKISGSRNISIVGTRASDPHSEMVAGLIASGLASAGCTVVSGMALGIDRAAHAGALDSGGGTMGVVPNGLDRIYPPANADLYERIRGDRNSGLISEYPPGVKPVKWTFARRNRIISGLSEAVVVVKAGAGSGALITARYAIEQNRELFVCPGCAYDTGYSGSLSLLREGAAAVSCVGDILSDLGISAPAGQGLLFNNREIQPEDQRVDFPEGSIEHMILKAVAGQGREIDALIRELKIAPPAANEAVINLELNGFIDRRGNHVRVSSQL
jgi:DNA processing protein